MTTLITGASGFTGKTLTALLSSEERLFLTDLTGGLSEKIIRCDLVNRSQVVYLLEKVRPERIYHLAGSFTNNYEIDYPVNVLGSKNIFDGLLELKLRCRVLLVGSSAEYGRIAPQDNPVKEDHALSPVKVHGLTKTFQTSLMQYYHKVMGMDLVMARTFNLYGQGGISNLMFVGRVKEQINELKRGEIKKICVGNLESKRDYINVKDAVRYYRKIMEQGISGEIYNVGSGSAIKMRDLLSILLQEAGLNEAAVEERPPGQPDNTDTPEIYADISKVKTL